MSDNFGSAWAEKCQELLDNEPMTYLVNSKDASIDFLIHIETSLHPEAFNGLIDAWLKTTYGKRWYEDTLDKLVRDQPENDDNPREDR